MKGKILVLLVSLALLVGVLSGCVEDDDEDEEPENNAPTAEFEVTDIEHNTSLDGGTVTFGCTASDEDEDDTITYLWDFGDDGTSDEEDPVHVYAANDSYDVTVTVDDGTDSFTTAATTVLVGNQAPVAGFTSVADNLTATFTDTSTDDGTVTTWLWDFGDDTNSTEQNPVKTYAENGTFTVTLTVTDEYGLPSVAYIDDEITVAQEE